MLNMIVGSSSRVIHGLHRRLSPINLCRASFSNFTASQLDAEKKTEKNVIYSQHSDCIIPDQTVVQRLLQRSSLWPNKVAIECGITGRKYTYNAMWMLIKRFGSSLKKMGFRKGDFAALILPNIPEFPIALFGAAGVGMPVTLLNPTYTVDEIAKQLNNCNATVLVGISMMADELQKVAPLCPSLKKIVLIGDRHDGFVDIKDMLQDSGDLFQDDIDIDLHNDTFIQPYSSGTTGLPKGVALSHRNVVANTQQVLHPGTTRIQDATDSYQEVQVAVLPFFHIYGMMTFMNIAFDAGAKIVSLPRFQVDTFINAIHTHQPTHLFTVPPLALLLANHPGLKIESLSRLHTITTGAASLKNAVAEKVLQRLQPYDVILQEGFGMSEGLLTHKTPINNKKLGSCGQLISRSKCKIIDVETGEALGPNQRGELCTQGPQTMKGYHNNPEGTREALDEAGWLHTGDIAYYDEDLNFFIVDRMKELIKVKGFQVSPTELEDLLYRHPGVLDAAVLGATNEYEGESPRAFIVKSPHFKGQLTENEIIQYVESQVAPHKRLTGGVVFVESIPKSNTGKILRREMKAKYL